MLIGSAVMVAFGARSPRCKNGDLFRSVNFGKQVVMVFGIVPLVSLYALLYHVRYRRVNGLFRGNFTAEYPSNSGNPNRSRRHADTLRATGRFPLSVPAGIVPGTGRNPAVLPAYPVRRRARYRWSTARRRFRSPCAVRASIQSANRCFNDGATGCWLVIRVAPSGN